MKKLFTFSMTIVLLVMSICSCNKDEAEKNNVYPTKNSEIVFTSPASFASRAAWPNSNQWSDKYSVPAEITIEEADAVYEYFKAHNADRQGEVSINYTNFFVQHVWRGTDTYALEDMNHAKHQVTGGNQMDQLCAGTKENPDHVFNFNACSGSIMCMENSSTAHFSYNDSYGDRGKMDGDWEHRHDKYIILSVPGYGTYLGFDYETYKNSGERHEGDGVYTDWIIKISNADGGTTPEPPVIPTVIPENGSGDNMVVGNGSVEFDIHQQEHKDWHEIKTSIHIRDTVNCRVFIPIKEEYQAEPDDFAIRVADKYEYITKTIEINNNFYNVHFAVGHMPEGIEIVIGTASCAQALKAARETFDDGLTFEVHTYVKPYLTPGQVWDMLKQTTCPQTSLSLWTYGAPLWQSEEQDVKTHIHGQITSAFFEERIDMNHNVKGK